MSEPENKFNQLKAVASDLSSHLNADIILFNQTISESSASKFHERIESIDHRHKTVFLILATLGGDAHAAYIIARDLQLTYEKVIICIAGDCYSAGTLIVLCAHELVLTNRGRLGPLDAQILKKDELIERLSGLTVGVALDELRKNVSKTVGAIALDLKLEFGRQLSFRTALDVAANVTAQIFGEVYKQVDPVRLGEDARSLQIAQHYGDILGRGSSNLKSDAVNRLLTSYPSHDCIIDRSEAKELFKNLRSPSKKEQDLLELLGALATEATNGTLVDVLMVFDFEDGENKQGESNEREENETSKNINNGRKPRDKHRGEEVHTGRNGEAGEG